MVMVPSSNAERLGPKPEGVSGPLLQPMLNAFAKGQLQLRDEQRKQRHDDDARRDNGAQQHLQ